MDELQVLLALYPDEAELFRKDPLMKYYPKRVQERLLLVNLRAVDIMRTEEKKIIIKAVVRGAK